MQSHEILARFDRIPIWPHKKRLLFIIGVGFFFSFFDIITIGLALPEIEKQMHVSLATATWAITSSLIGYIIGSITLARVSDKFGRKIALYLSIGFFSIGSLLTAFAMTFSWIVIFRFITGIGIGAEISEVSTYLGEASPTHCRGRYTTIAIAFGMLGFAVVPFVALALVPNYSWGFRAMFLLGGIGGLVIFFMRRDLPETIRWLVAHKQFEKAEASLLAIEEKVSKKITLSPVTTAAVETIQRTTGIKELFKPPYSYRLLLFAGIWFFYYIGNYAWLTLAANLFIAHGIGLAKSLKFVAIDSVGFVIGSLIAVWAGDRIERKFSCIIGSSVWVLALLLVGWDPSITTIVIGGLMASTSIGFVIPIMYTYTAENFPTQFRATSVAITDGLGHLGGAFCGQIILGLSVLFANAFSGAFTIMAATGVITIIFLSFGVHMTHKSLSQVHAKGVNSEL